MNDPYQKQGTLKADTIYSHAHKHQKTRAKPSQTKPNATFCADIVKKWREKNTETKKQYSTIEVINIP